MQILEILVVILKIINFKCLVVCQYICIDCSHNNRHITQHSKSGQPFHDVGVSVGVHLGSQEQGMAPQVVLHCPVQRILKWKTMT